MAELAQKIWIRHGPHGTLDWKDSRLDTVNLRHRLAFAGLTFFFAFLTFVFDMLTQSLQPVLLRGPFEINSGSS